MKIALVALVCSVGCGFQGSSTSDGGAGPDGQTPIDAGSALDAPPDTSVARVRTNLIALWDMDQHDATTIAETSGFDTAVPLSANAGTVVTFADSAMTLSGGNQVVWSASKPRLNANINASSAVTLEAWVSAAAADQGTPSAPVVVAGLSASINSRNISILQVGKRWVARVRTNADKNGLPELTSPTDIVAGELTHLVVVAEATRRAFYINGQAVVDAAPAAPTGWDASYRVVLGNETSLNRGWAGTIALVAMYRQALTQVQVATNLFAGPNGQ